MTGRRSDQFRWWLIFAAILAFVVSGSYVGLRSYLFRSRHRPDHYSRYRRSHRHRPARRSAAQGIRGSCVLLTDRCCRARAPGMCSCSPQRRSTGSSWRRDG